MTDLTEQWQKGELPNGMYYMENTSGIIGMVGHSKVFPCYNVKQILASVPTYEEWQASEKYNKHLEEVIKVYERKDKQATKTSIAYNGLLEENAQLKELLKEARNVLKMVDTYYGDYDSINGFLIVEKINQVLGEDK